MERQESARHAGPCRTERRVESDLDIAEPTRGLHRPLHTGFVRAGVDVLRHPVADVDRFVLHRLLALVARSPDLAVDGALERRDEHGATGKLGGARCLEPRRARRHDARVDDDGSSRDREGEVRALRRRDAHLMGTFERLPERFTLAVDLSVVRGDRVPGDAVVEGGIHVRERRIRGAGWIDKELPHLAAVLPLGEIRVGLRARLAHLGLTLGRNVRERLLKVLECRQVDLNVDALDLKVSPRD